MSGQAAYPSGVGGVVKAAAAGGTAEVRICHARELILQGLHKHAGNPAVMDLLLDIANALRDTPLPALDAQAGTVEVTQQAPSHA